MTRRYCTSSLHRIVTKALIVYSNKGICYTFRKIVIRSFHSVDQLFSTSNFSPNKFILEAWKLWKYECFFISLESIFFFFWDVSLLWEYTRWHLPQSERKESLTLRKQKAKISCKHLEPFNLKKIYNCISTPTSS